MTPVEKLEAAITKLETERAAATTDDLIVSGWHDGTAIPGAWQAWDSGHGSKPDGNFSSVLSSAENVRLLVTLHRAIDPQLDWLRDQADRMKLDVNQNGIPLHYRHSIATAESILGDLS